MNKIALIGRQNVGKSSLFNCIIKNKTAIAVNFPGYTRDKIYSDVKINSKLYTIIDTTGICFKKNKINLLSLRQTWEAIKESDILLLIFDAESGLTNLDESIKKNIKKTKKHTIYIINKIDKINKYEKLNFENDFKINAPILTSAKSNDGIEEIKKKIIFLTKPNTTIKEKKNLKITIIGKPNVGKSSFINKLINKKKITTFNESGTTRDILHIDTKIKKNKYTLIDTPGITNIERKNLIKNISIKKSINEITKSNTILLMIDSISNITKQDLNLIKIVIKEGKAIILVINKADIKTKKELIKTENEIKKNILFAKFISFNFLSTKYNFGIKNILNKINILTLFQNEEYSTSYLKKIIKNLNKFLEKKNIKIYYSKIENYTPLIINIYLKKYKNLKINYKKYIINYLLDKLNITSIPIKINFKLINLNKTCLKNIATY